MKRTTATMTPAPAFQKNRPARSAGRRGAHARSDSPRNETRRGRRAPVDQHGPRRTSGAASVTGADSVVPRAGGLNGYLFRCSAEVQRRREERLLRWFEEDEAQEAAALAAGASGEGDGRDALEPQSNPPAAALHVTLARPRTVRWDRARLPS